MEQEHLYTIGDMSKICNICKKTLRFYDEKKLLKPTYIDPDTRRRFYSNKDVFLLTVIVELKSHGLSLNEIKEYINNEDLNLLVDVYRKTRQNLNEQIANLINTRNRLDTNLNIIEEYLINNDTDYFKDDLITIKKIKERKLVCKPKSLDKVSKSNVKLLINDAQKHSKKSGTKLLGPYLLIVDFEQDKEKPTFKAGFIIDSDFDANIDDDLLHVMPEGLYATKTYKSTISENNNMQKFKSFVNWIDENNYNSEGPFYIIYLNSIQKMKPDKQIIFEIQKKISIQV